MRGERRGREIVARYARGLMIQKGIEDVAAGAATQGQGHALAVRELGEDFAEAEGAGLDAGLHVRKQLAGAAQVGFVRDPRQGGAVSNTLDSEVELNATGSERFDAAGQRFPAHMYAP